MALWGGAALAQDHVTAQTDPCDDPTAPCAETTVEGTGGSGTESDAVPLAESDTNVNIQPAQPAPAATAPVIVVDDDDDRKKDEDKHDMRGLQLMVGGGVEGYTGALAPEVQVGPSYGVTAALKPTKVLGIELGYSGAVNEVRGGDVNGADIVRNGGHALLTLGLGASPVQPYLMGGVGFSHYDARTTDARFSDDTSGNIPLGAGLRTHIGNFTADLRANYNVLFDQDFAAGLGVRDIAGIDAARSAGRYDGMLNIGTTF
jgi:hypothetical protein